MKQYLVVYLKDGRALATYDTAYTPGQAREAAARRYRRHGNARVVDAARMIPGDLLA